MKFDIKDHLLGNMQQVHPMAPNLVEAECSCSNPDGNGDGLMRFTGDSLAEIAVQWLEHVESFDTSRRVVVDDFNHDTTPAALDAYSFYYDLPENPMGRSFYASQREQDAFTAGFDAARRSA